MLWLRSSALAPARSAARGHAVAAALLGAGRSWARGGVGVGGPGEEARETGSDGRRAAS